MHPLAEFERGCGEGDAADPERDREPDGDQQQDEEAGGGQQNGVMSGVN